MRIAFIHPRFPSAEGTGATYSATQIVNGLVELNHEVCVYCTHYPQESPKISGMETQHLIGNSNHPHTNTRLNREVEARLDELREYDIVHSYLTSLIPSITKVGEASDVGTVVTLNAYKGICAKNDLLYQNQEHCQSKSPLKCLNCIARTGLKNDNEYLYQTASQLLSLPLIQSVEHRLDSIDGFHALSPHLKETYTDFGYKANKIEVIPNILDPKFDINHKTEFEEPYKLLYVGYLKRAKGVDRLINVLSHVLEKTSKSVKLTVVGGGELADKLEAQVENKGLSEVVDLRGQVPNKDLPRVYANHDLFVYPSRWDEPFGRVFLESMAAGTSIVSTDVGSVQNIIGDGGVCTKQSSHALADAILSSLNKDTLSTRSEACKRRIQNYRVNEIIPQFETLYANVMSQSR